MFELNVDVIELVLPRRFRQGKTDLMATTE